PRTRTDRTEPPGGRGRRRCERAAAPASASRRAARRVRRFLSTARALHRQRADDCFGGTGAVAPTASRSISALRLRRAPALVAGRRDPLGAMPSYARLPLCGADAALRAGDQMADVGAMAIDDEATDHADRDELRIESPAKG